MTRCADSMANSFEEMPHHRWIPHKDVAADFQQLLNSRYADHVQLSGRPLSTGWDRTSSARARRALGRSSPPRGQSP